MQHETATCEASPSVHPIETNERSTPPSSYRSHLLQKCQAEYDRTLEIYELLDTSNTTHKRWDLEQCRDTAYFSIDYETRRVHVSSSACRLRWCPLCSLAKTAYISHAVSAWLNTIKNASCLTLTLKHTDEELQRQVTRLYACFRTLRRRKFFRNLCNGGIWFFQIKYIPATDSWHPHLHCLLTSSYIPQKLLSATWKTITGDSDIVDIRRIWGNKQASDYVARYASRPSLLKDMPLSRALDVVAALHGRRLCGTWGKASTVSLRPAPHFSAASHHTACRWSTMLRYINSSTWVQQLYHAWQSHKPFPAHLCFASLDGPFAEIPPDMLPDPPPADYGGLYD